MELFERIRIDKREEGLSMRALARRHKVHRRTVRQAIAAALPPPRQVASRAAPALGPHLPTIRAWLTDDLAAPRKQRHTARRVWERLVDEEGAVVAESTVRAYVGEIKAELESGTRLVTVPQTHPPGDEAEVDFGEATVVIAGVPVKVEIFHLRLSHSAKAVHVAFASEGQEALLEGHVLAFDRLGGVPGRIRYDNLTPAVSRVLTGRGWSPSAPPTGSTFCCAGRMTWTWRPLPNSLHSQSSGVLLVAPPAASARADRRSAFFSGTTTLTDI